MFDRNWYDHNAHWLAVAIGLVFITVTSWSLLYSKGYQAANQSREAENAAYSAAYEAHQNCLGLDTLNDVRECFAGYNHTPRAEHRAEQDLNAQREMANWAEGMLWSSWLATVLMGVGILYVAATLREARQTTNAAIGMNDLTKRIEKPLLEIKVIGKNIKIDPKTGIIKDQILFSIVNMGRSPNGFAMAWPAKNADKYNYCREV